MDTDWDWENLLTFVYYPRKIKEQKREFSFDFLASLLRLGKKYGFKHMREEALENLKKSVPLKFKDVHRRSGIDRDRIFDFINLAVELNIRTILPNLYYMCAINYSMEEILNGFPGPGASDSVSRLTQSALTPVLVGRDKVRSAIIQHIFSWTFNETSALPHKKCTKSKDCRTACLSWKKQCVDYFGSAEFKKLYYLALIVIVPGSLCGECRASALAERDRGIASFRKSLPSLLNLPQWEGLEDFAI